MDQRSYTTNTEPSSAAAFDRALNIDIVKRFFGGRLRETQEFILNHLEKRSARQRQQRMSPKDQDLILRLELQKLKGKHHGII